jgi:hypothetical protein
MFSRRTFTAALLLSGLVRPAVAKPISATLYKNPDCECCDVYAEYLRKHGFAVTVMPTNNLSEIDRRAGLLERLEGCHTTFIDRYFVSGHVPIEAVEMLLTQRPSIKGITLPGMPTGSPGMAGSKLQAFTIFAIALDGASSVFTRV